MLIVGSFVVCSNENQIQNDPISNDIIPLKKQGLNRSMNTDSSCNDASITIIKHQNSLGLVGKTGVKMSNINTAPTAIPANAEKNSNAQVSGNITFMIYFCF